MCKVRGLLGKVRGPMGEVRGLLGKVRIFRLICMCNVRNLNQV